MKVTNALVRNIALFAAMFVLVAVSYSQDKALVEVEAKYVCMINNQKFDKEQIPIKVAKVTYYGCCEMCKERLQKDPRSRVAIDPVSGRKVDKAKAVIGADSNGKVYYFENADNLKRFKGR